MLQIRPPALQIYKIHAGMVNFPFSRKGKHFNCSLAHFCLVHEGIRPNIKQSPPYPKRCTKYRYPSLNTSRDIVVRKVTLSFFTKRK